MMGKAVRLPPKITGSQWQCRFIACCKTTFSTVAVMVTAFEDALRELGLSDRADPATELVARKIIELAERGERDPARLRDQVVRSLSK